MSFTITHRMGDMESDPPLDRLRALIGELDADDPEHPDVAVSHESGWTLSAYSDGLVVWENVEEGDDPRHLRGVARERLLDLFTAVAQGDLDAVEKEAWLPGYP